MSNQYAVLVEELYPDTDVKPSIVLPPPSVVPARDVFAEAMLEKTSARQKRSWLDWFVSFAIHGVLLLEVLLVPLVMTQNLDLQKSRLTLLVAPLPPMAAPPPPPAAAPRLARSVQKTVYTPGKLTAPAFIPRAVPVASGDAAAPDDILAGVPGGVPGGVDAGRSGGIFGGVVGGLAAPVRPAVPAAEGPKKPVRVGGDVKPPRLLVGPAPKYPPLARSSRIQGIVVIEAIIDELGKVTGARAISGPPLLIPAALEAVSQRRYEPTILNGEPTPIGLRMEVGFRLEL